MGRGVAGVLGEEEVRKSKAVVKSERGERGWIVEPDWMGEPELR